MSNCISIGTIVIKVLRFLKVVKLPKDISKVDNTNSVSLQASILAIISRQMSLLSIT